MLLNVFIVIVHLKQDVPIISIVPGNEFNQLIPIGR